MDEENILFYEGNNVSMIEKHYQNSLEKDIQELIIFYGMKLMKKNKAKNQLYKWSLYENILKASIELNLNEFIDICFNKLKEKFGKIDGKKLNILKGMICECTNKNEEALNIYKNFLKKDPCDILIRARIMNLKKIVEKDINKVIQLLNDHLKEFPVDIESWHELGEIYIINCLYSYAIFCFEEILLHIPTNLYYILTCAELHYTINQLELSSKYFCLAIKLQSNNLRGLWGIIILNITRYLNRKPKLLNENVDIILTIHCINRLYSLYSEIKVDLIYKNTILDYLNELRDMLK
ncbi:ER membrane protein complex subunit 2 [Plasmodium brasilianum]|uniref:ER membrane protein complex subunit 2 n=2 Tax=Plasmodium (Plasmodium) TaxID=418103 RepID=A0A1A8W9W0_PLAMA|nr:ER membrane protein complex subunit 2, putative [Plasmodium malariae]KAI4835900.1 ER membrane protein complex subunit 2 [Plasmodium brasilianum]SBS89820.1 ER membrane protein complex subunit 2, putative [Plasmodium malariae]SCP02837.1 ER membrane protein complex subunit 2, putative [Plasmodium malariae]